MKAAVLAVDGGNSKTDLALVGIDGAVLALATGPQSSPHHVGLDGCLAVLERLLEEAAPGEHPAAAVGHLLLAGADLEEEEAALQAAVAARGWAARATVGNDTFAILRAGTDRGWGIAVTCGAGINCVGVAPDGRHARFPALGAITGDWGGGYDVGLAALSAAARSEDGRGPATSLQHAVPAAFGVATPRELAESIHLGRIPLRDVVDLAPVVLAESERDDVAAGIVDQLAGEVVAFVRVAATRLGLLDAPVEVLLGGGMLRPGHARLHAGIEEGLAEVGSGFFPRVVSAPPIVGAALLGLDELGAGLDAQARVRRELTEMRSVVDV
jgi:N-acetylglucosamine kinase-like BadF-type ATPase